MRALRLVPLLAAVACGPEFPPRSSVFETRVLAIEASRLEVGPAESVTLRAYRVDTDAACDPAKPTGPIVFERWSFCPFSLGSSAGYACAVPECEDTIALEPPPPSDRCGFSNPVTATPGALAEQCLALLSASGQIPAGLPAQLPERIDTLFRYSVQGTTGPREAVQRIPLYPAGAPADRNLPPTILSVAIGGTTWAPPDAPGSGPAPVLPHANVLDVVVTTGAPQTYVEGGRTLTEQIVVSFLASAGRFDYDRANGPEARVKLKNEETGGATSAQVWVVARDLRGGEVVAGPYPVTIEP